MFFNLNNLVISQGVVAIMYSRTIKIVEFRGDNPNYSSQLPVLNHGPVIPEKKIS
jgi:hypothetical protein